MLTEERILGMNLPRITKRYVLEEDEILDAYVPKVDLTKNNQNIDVQSKNSKQSQDQ